MPPVAILRTMYEIAGLIVLIVLVGFWPLTLLIVWFKETFLARE